MRRLFAGLAEVERGGKPWRTRQQRILRRRQDTCSGNVAGHRLLLFASGWALLGLHGPARVNGSIGRTSPSRPVLFSGIATRTYLLPHVPKDWNT